MAPIARILVPTDFSESADQACTYALTLAEKVDLRAQILTDLRRQLGERAAAVAGAKNVPTEVLTGAPARAIVEDAKRHQCDLIVMGTHGRRGMAHLLLGSVAERVVRTAECPVLIVRPQTK